MLICSDFEELTKCITRFLLANGYTRWDNISLNEKSDTSLLYDFDGFKNTNLPVLPFNLLFHHINGSDNYVFSTHGLDFSYKRGWAFIYDLDIAHLKQYNDSLIFPVPPFHLTFHHKGNREFEFMQSSFKVEMNLIKENDEFLQLYKHHEQDATVLYRILQSLFQQDFKNNESIQVKDLSYNLSNFLQAKYNGTKGSPYDPETKKLDLPSYVRRLRHLKESGEKLTK